MDRMPPGSGVCCLPRIGGITYLQIGAEKALIGMVDLETVFQQLYALGRRPENATDAELVRLARRSNYIPSRTAIEADYAAALRQAYTDFFSRQVATHG